MRKSLIFIATCVFCSAIALEASEKGSMKGSMDEKTKVSQEMKKTSSGKEVKGSPAGDTGPLAAILAGGNQAVATMAGTSAAPDINGQVILAQTEDGVMVLAAFSNVPGVGKHGFHVHENGSCDDDGKAAGGHFNPKGVDHGFLPEGGLEGAHLGDMGNIDIDENGQGSLMIILPGVTLDEGEAGISGKAVILHEKEDDFGQPTGNAGGRIACGIIQTN